MNRKLQQSLKKQKKSTKKESLRISGTLGLPLDGIQRVEVPNRNAFVFVKLRDNQSEVIQAFNNKVAPSYGLPVIVEWHNNRYTIVDVDTARYQNNWVSYAPFLPRHGNTHSFDLANGGGGDIVWVHTRQFMPSLVIPSGTQGAPNVMVSSYMLRNDDGSWKYVGDTGTASFQPYKPVTGTQAVMALVYLDSVSGNPYLMVGSGSYFPSSITGSAQIAPYIPRLTNPAHIPLAAVRLVTGTSNILWNNIYDVRQFLHPIITGSSGGSSGGGSGINVWHEGVDQGNYDTLNFVGDYVNIQTLTPGVVNINITGSNLPINITGSRVGPDQLMVGTSPSAGYLYALRNIGWGTPDGTKQYIEFGFSAAGKESNAGKLGYEIFQSGFLEIVGAGTSGGNRWVLVYDNLKVNSQLMTSSLQILNLHNTWVYLNGTGTAIGGINSPEQVVVTGTDWVLGLNGGNSQGVRFSVNNLAEGIFYKDVIGAFLGGIQVPASTTWFGCPFKSNVDILSNSVAWAEGGVLSNMSLRISSSQPASGALVATLQVEGADTALVITVSAGTAGPVTLSNTSNQVVMAAGNTLRWKFANAATAASATLQGITMLQNKPATA